MIRDVPHSKDVLGSILYGVCKFSTDHNVAYWWKCIVICQYGSPVTNQWRLQLCPIDTRIAQLRQDKRSPIMMEMFGPIRCSLKIWIPVHNSYRVAGTTLTMCGVLLYNCQDNSGVRQLWITSSMLRGWQRLGRIILQCFLLWHRYLKQLLSPTLFDLWILHREKLQPHK